jgi:hypothetical protein
MDNYIFFLYNYIICKYFLWIISYMCLVLWINNIEYVNKFEIINNEKNLSEAVIVPQCLLQWRITYLQASHIYVLTARIFSFLFVLIQMLLFMIKKMKFDNGWVYHIRRNLFNKMEFWICFCQFSGIYIQRWFFIYSLNFVAKIK